MRLIEIKPVGGGLSATFEQGGRQLTKSIRLGDCARAILKESQYGPYLRSQLVWKAREAVRDFAYMEHGEDWKQHVEWGQFWSAPNDKELRMIDEALG